MTYLRENPPAINDRDISANAISVVRRCRKATARSKVPLRDNFVSKYRPAQTAGKLLEIIDVTHDIREFRFALEKPNGFLPASTA